MSTDSQERAHAKRSPSTMNDRAACPGYDPTPDDGKPHPITEQGSRLHDNLEAYFKGKPEPFPMDDEEINLYAVVLKYVVECCPPEEWQYVAEPKLYTHHPDTWGYADLFAINKENPRIAIIFDFKFGYTPVKPAKDNLQGLCYSLGALLASPKRLQGYGFETKNEIEQVTMIFLQPRRDFVSYHTYTKTDTKEMMRIVNDIHARIDRGEELNAGAVCTFCFRRPTCPAYNAFSQTQLAAVQSHLGDFTVDLTQLGDDPVAWGKARAWAEWLEGFAKVVLQASKAQAEGLDGIAGYRFIEAASPIKAVDPGAIIEVAKAYLTEQEIAQHYSLKVGSLAKAVGQSAPNGMKKHRENNFREGILDSGAAAKEGTVHKLIKDKDFWQAQGLPEKPNLNKALTN